MLACLLSFRAIVFWLLVLIISQLSEVMDCQLLFIYFYSSHHKVLWYRSIILTLKGTCFCYVIYEDILRGFSDKIKSWIHYMYCTFVVEIIRWCKWNHGNIWFLFEGFRNKFPHTWSMYIYLRQALLVLFECFRYYAALAKH